MSLKFYCRHNPAIYSYAECPDTDEEEIDDSESVEEFIGLALHSIQQGVSDSLHINGHKIHAILMDQTSGSPADMEDIYKLELHYPNNGRGDYQRLRNIIYNDFQP